MSIEPFHLHFARPGLRSRIDLFFADKGQGFNPMPMVRSRLASILRLDAMSDEELAEFGLTRDGILPFVFEDCFGDIAAPNKPPTA